MIAVLPDLVYSLTWLVWAYPPPPPFLALHLFLLVRSVSIGAVVLYLIHRSGEPKTDFGLRRTKWFLVPVFGLTIFVVVELAIAVLIAPLQSSGPTLEPAQYVFPRPTGVADYLVLVVASCANGFCEELVMRSYLIRRFEQLWGSTVLSLLATSALFGLYHLYQGVPAAINVTVFGLLIGIVYCLTRNLWNLAFAHALADVRAFAWTGMFG